jgi:hypothetical protein
MLQNFQLDKQPDSAYNYELVPIEGKPRNGPKIRAKGESDVA